MRSLPIALTLTCCLVVTPRFYAHAQAADSAQNKSADNGQKKASTQKQGGSSSGANPFPEDTSSVPVVPTGPPSAATAPAGGDVDNVRLPQSDLDPVRSPDQPADSAASADQGGSSSSLQGLGQLLPPPGSEAKVEKQPSREESVKEDLNVGGYYLDSKNWKGALSRFESALVLDPENPEVYWGLAECERHLGDYAAAKAHYVKVLEYDPGSHHAKDARKALKLPEIANAPAVSSNPAPARTPQ